MAEATRSYFRGADELYQELSTKIPYRMEAKALQSAISAGATVVVKAAKANVGRGGSFPQSRSGALKRSIYQGKGRKSTPQEQIRIVNVRRGTKAQAAAGRSAYYGRMVEFGHRAGKSGWAAPHPFMEPAYQSTQGAAQLAISVKLEKLVDQAVKRSGYFR